MKTIYIKPEIHIIKIKIEGKLLAGSSFSISNGGEGSNEDFADARQYNVWESADTRKSDDWEEQE